MTSEATQITQLVSQRHDLPTRWGRWGERDERATLNLIPDEVRARAVAEARTGRTVSLARPIPTTPVAARPRAPSTAVLQALLFTGASPRAMAELVVMMTRHPEVTHVDALARQGVDGQVYPVLALEEAAGPAGLRHGSTAVFAHGVVTRGVLVDLARDGPLPDGHGVTGAELQAACTQSGLRCAAGTRRWCPTRPAPDRRRDLTELAAACAEEGRAAFLFVAAPPPLGAASGVPVNPLAIF